VIDVDFDFRIESGDGDPDRNSPTLKRYHRALWSKPLPSGGVFDLESAPRPDYLRDRSTARDFVLTSDGIVHPYDYGGWLDRMPYIRDLPADEIETFVRAGCTIGAYILFPVEYRNSPTVNQARGTRSEIADRFDLTLECIRRHYAEDSSPLSDVLAAYRGFFDLFVDFHRYVEFWLLDDLVDPATGSVRFVLPFDGFSAWPVPGSADEYRAYRDRTLEFVSARNARISTAPEAAAD
jgi:hypothetical protein